MLRLAALVTAVAAGAPTAVLATTAQAQAGAGSPSPVQYVLMQNEKSNQMQPNQIPFAVPHARPTPVSYAERTEGRPGATSLAQTQDRATAYREVSAEGQTHPHGRVSALVTHQKHQHQQHHATRSARRMAVSQTASHSHAHAFSTKQDSSTVTTPTDCSSDAAACDSDTECCTTDTGLCSSTEQKDPDNAGMCMAATTATDSSTAAVTTTTTESTTAAAKPLVPYKDKCQAELDADEDAKRLNRRCCDSRSLRAALGACGVTREDLESISSNTGGERNGAPLDGAADDAARSAMSDQLLWSKVYEGATKSELDGLIRQMDGNHVCMGICQFAAQKCWQLGYVRKSAPNACEGMKHWILTSSTTALLTGAAAPRASATWAFSALAGVLATAFAVML